MRLRYVTAAVCLASCAVLLSGCGFGSRIGNRLESIANGIIYRPDTPQGNLITREMIEQIEVGMAKNQVQFLLGEPLIRDLFHGDRWDYTYYYNPLRGEVQLRSVVIFFNEDERVVRVESPDLPTEQQADELIVGIDTDYDPTQHRERKLLLEAAGVSRGSASGTQATGAGGTVREEPALEQH